MRKNKVVIHPEHQFISDATRWSKQFPNIWDEIEAIMDELKETGSIPKEYHPHLLTNPMLNYSGYDEFHLLDNDKICLLVIYKLKANKSYYRFVRLGTHEELFHSNLK